MVKTITGMLLISILVSTISLLSGTSYNVSRFITKTLYGRGIMEAFDVATPYISYNTIGVTTLSIGTIISANYKTAPIAVITLPIIALRVFVMSMDVVDIKMDKDYRLDSKRITLDILANVSTIVHAIALMMYY